MLSVSLRERLLRLSGAIGGLALAISLGEVMMGPAREGQMAGFMTANDLDASGPMKTVVLAVLLPFLGAFAIDRLLPRIREARSWVMSGVAVSALFAFAVAAAGGSLVAVTAAMAGAGVIIFAARNRELRLTRHDGLLLPAGLTLFSGAALIFPGLELPGLITLSTLAMVAVRLLVEDDDRAGKWFGASPVAMLIVAAFPGSRAAGVVTVSAVIVLPFILRLSRRSLGILVAFVVLPLFASSYSWVQRPVYSEGMPRLNFFEDGHSLLPAAEMMRGERPYADIVPGHGLVSDGLLDVALARTAGDSLGSILRNRERIETLLAAAIYFVALAASGSPVTAILAFLLATSVRVFWTPLEAAPTALMWTPAIRSLPAVTALAFLVAAVRLRSRKALFFAGLLGATALWVSVDFFAYIALAMAIVTVRFGDRRRALTAALGGGAVGFAMGALPLLVIGLADDFFVVTLTEVLSLAEAYGIGFFQLHERLRFYQGFPEITALLFVPSALWFVAWGAIALYTLAEYARRIFRSVRRSEALLVVGLFIVVLAVAYGERLNVHFMPLACVFAAVGAQRLWRGGLRAAALALSLVLVIVAGPTRHLRSIRTQLRPGEPAAGWVEYPASRARGARMESGSAAALALTQRYVEGRLAPGETLFDFASMPVLYYLLDRPCPIRQYEVPFFQFDRLQQEVIARLEADRTVRAVLMSFPDRNLPIDGVSSEVRAPLVAAYLRREFVPDFSEGGVVFWRRR
jgi:hypothetical protein